MMDESRRNAYGAPEISQSSRRDDWSEPVVQAGGGSIATLLQGESSERDVPPGFLSLPSTCSLAQLGVQPTRVGRRSARSLTEVVDVHLNQRGEVQGGVYGVLADATAGWATEGFLGEPSYATTGFSGQLLGSAGRGDRLQADAHVVHGGRRTVVVSVEVRRLRAENEPRLVAVFTCHQLVTSAPA